MDPQSKCLQIQVKDKPLYEAMGFNYNASAMTINL